MDPMVMLYNISCFSGEFTHDFHNRTITSEPLREELVGYNVVQSLAASLTHRDADVCISVCKALAALVGSGSPILAPPEQDI